MSARARPPRLATVPAIAKMIARVCPETAVHYLAPRGLHSRPVSAATAGRASS